MRHNKLKLLTSFIFLSIYLISCSQPQRGSSEDTAHLFTLGQGWMGGDAAYSIPVNSTKIIWLFGDTFADPEQKGIRSFNLMVGNSIGVSEKINGLWQSKFIYRTDKQGKPAAFFDSGSETVRYWPRHGFVLHGFAHVFLVEVTKTGDGPFGFTVSGECLASFDVRNLNSKTPVKIEKLPVPKKLMLGSAVMMDRGLPYIFSTMDGSETKNKNRPLYLSRWSDGGWQFFNKDGAWQAGLFNDNAKEILPDATSEMSVHFHRRSSKWVMVYSDSDIHSGKIWVRKASAPTGPWSDPQLLMSVPELTGNSKVPFSFSYAAKAHPALEKDGRLAITYVVNLDEDPKDSSRYSQFHLWRILKPEYHTYYVPNLVYVDLPQ